MDRPTPSKQARLDETDDGKPKMAPPGSTSQKTSQSGKNLSTQESTLEILEKIDICQGELENLNEAASEEIINIEERFNTLRQPYIDQRSEAIQKIPNFWICTFVNHPLLAPRLNEEDEECLHYLRQLKVHYRDELKTGYMINFHFAKNPFFENELISKEFSLTGDGEPMSQSTIIRWKPGMDITKKMNPATGKTEGTSASFFSWFADHVDAGNDEVADVLRDDLWSNPLQYYLIPDIDDSLDRSLLDSFTSDGTDDIQTSSSDVQLVSRDAKKSAANSPPDKTRVEKTPAESKRSKMEADSPKSTGKNSSIENNEKANHSTS